MHREAAGPTTEPSGRQPGDAAGPSAQPLRQQHSPIRSSLKRTSSAGAGVGEDVQGATAALERASLTPPKGRVSLNPPAPPSPEGKTHGGSLFASLSAPPSPEGNGVDTTPPPPADAAAWNWAAGRAPAARSPLVPAHVANRGGDRAVLPASLVPAAPVGPEETTHAHAEGLGTQDGEYRV